jgi:hypothetical protein
VKYIKIPLEGYKDQSLSDKCEKKDEILPRIVSKYKPKGRFASKTKPTRYPSSLEHQHHGQARVCM